MFPLFQMTALARWCCVLGVGLAGAAKLQGGTFMEDINFDDFIHSSGSPGQYSTVQYSTVQVSRSVQYKSKIV